MSSVPVFRSGALIFVTATFRMPLDGLALVAGKACIPGSQGTVTIGSWQAVTPRAVD